MGAPPAMLVELFPVEDRLTGYSLAYNLGLGIAGGTAPMVATWLIKVSGVNSAPGAYLVVASAVSVIALWFTLDRSRVPLRRLAGFSRGFRDKNKQGTDNGSILDL